LPKYRLICDTFIALTGRPGRDGELKSGGIGSVAKRVPQKRLLTGATQRMFVLMPSLRPSQWIIHDMSYCRSLTSQNLRKPNSVRLLASMLPRWSQKSYGDLLRSLV